MPVAHISATTFGIAASIVSTLAIAASTPTDGRATPRPRTCNGQPATVVGTNRPDTIVGMSRTDVIVGLDGNDRIDGAGGHDVICGGDGDDTLRGGAGTDELLGGHGHDRLSGGPGGVVYWTGEPTPWEGLYGGPGRDELDRRDLRWGRFAGDRCFLGNAFVACPGTRPKGLAE